MCNWHSCYLPICSFSAHKISKEILPFRDCCIWRMILVCSYGVQKKQYRIPGGERKITILIKELKSAEVMKDALSTAAVHGQGKVLQDLESSRVGIPSLAPVAPAVPDKVMTCMCACMRAKLL